MTRRGLVLAGVLLLAFGIVLAATDPFAADHAAGAVDDNGTPTALSTVQRRSLTAQETVTGTLGYAGAWTVAIMAGTSTADLRQAEQQATSADAAYATAQATLAGDEQTLAAAEAELQAARLKAASDCTGAAAAASPSATVASPCATSAAAAGADLQALPAARQKVAADRAQLAAGRSARASAHRAVEAAHATSPAYGSSASYTMLPAAGDVVRRAQALYAIDGSDTLLLYGATPAWRTFAAGMSPGRDVAELNGNLRTLGFASGDDDSFTSATAQGIESLQAAHGLAVSGALALGSVVFEPGAARVTSVTPTVGQSVQPGPFLTLSSTRHEVAIQLDVSQQSQVRAGDRVVVSLPDNRTTPGLVASVGRVASAAPAGQGTTGATAPGSPTIPVAVRLLRPGDAGTLDQAPVNVLITTASLSDVLVVPVTALVAVVGGGYALEEVSGTTHRLIPVTPGLFDDQEGLVQVTGAGIAAGQRVVVPAS